MTKSEQNRADAMTDAETLLRSYYREAAERFGSCVPGFVRCGFEWAAYTCARRAARAAFRAVPGLREEDR